MIKRQMKSAATILLMLLTLATASWSMEPNDSAALSGLQQSKGIFLLSTGDPQMAAFYLEGVKSSHQSMAKQKVKPETIVVIIGPAVRLLTTEPAAELAESKEAIEAIATSIRELNELGIRMEVCAIATDYFKVPNDKLLPQLDLVADGWISLIGYQNKGYGFVPSF